MDDFQLTTPVALLFFNRPETTRRVFAEIRRARPARLLLVSDGPRPGRADDAANCAAAREVVAEIDWPCEVLRNISSENLGCKRRVSSGLDWVFAQAEEAIILEDDCVPHPTFFRFCQELLERYRDDQRVFHITGNHFRFTGERNPCSYYFSRFSFIWGWASWRRAWKFYDVEMKLWPAVRDGRWIERLFDGTPAAKGWVREFQEIYEGKIDTWDYQWGLATWIHSGLSIRPNVNLVSNIGFHSDATHTRIPGRTANLPTEAMEFPLRHPLFMMPDAYEDQFRSDGAAPRTLPQRLREKVKRLRLFQHFRQLWIKGNAP